MTHLNNKAGWLQPEWPDLADKLVAFATTRSGGVSAGAYADGGGAGGLNLALHVGDDDASVIANRQKINTILTNPVTFLSQVHGTMVMDAAGLSPDLAQPSVADAVFTSQPGLACAVMTADCLPVLLVDQHATVVAAAHAGWRGLVNGILQNTVTAMRTRSQAELRAWLGPAISVAHFEVGAEVKQEFELKLPGSDKFFYKKNTTSGSEKYHADLYSLAKLALQQVGVEAVTGGEWCTFADEPRFYSYRRNAVTGRMASVICLR